MGFQSVGGVSAPFAAVDESVESLAQVLERIAGLQGALERLAGAINSASRGIGSAADGMTRAVDSIDRIAAVLASSAEGASNFPSSGGGGTAGGGGGQGGDGRSFSLGLLSGLAEQEFGPFELSIGYGFYKSISEAMDENQALTQTLSAFNVPGLTGAQGERDLDLLHEIARVSAVGTSYTGQETAQAMLGAAPMDNFTGTKGIEAFAGVFPSALPMAEVGQMRGLGSIADNLKAAIGYADLTQRYNAGQLAPGLDEILAIVEGTHMSLSSVEATMKGGLPVAAAAGTNIDQATQAIGYLMHAGLGQSAGNAVGQIIVGATTTGGPMNAGLAQERAAAAQATDENAPQFRDMTAHAQALRDLGVTDAAGRLTVLNAEGGVDLGKILGDIRSYGAHHTSTDLTDVLHQAFGIQGMPEATLRALQQGSFADFEKLIAGTPGAAAQQATFPATPLQQFERSLARLQDIGNALATAILPQFTALEMGLVGFLDAVESFLSRHKLIASVLGYAAAGAAGGWVVGGPEGAAAGAAIGAGITYTTGTLENEPNWIKAHHLAVAPPSLRPPSEITVNAPLSVTVQGDMLGDYASLSAFLSDWWEKNAGAIGDAVNRQIRRMQVQARRSTMQDYGNEAVHPGGVTMGGP